MLRTSLGHPDEAAEIEIMRRRLERGTDDVVLDPVVDAAAIRRLQVTVETVTVAAPVIEYCVAIVRATREAPQVHAGASPRGVDALVKSARARALLDDRDYITPDDVKAVALPALAHRLVLRPELWVRGVEGASIVTHCLDSVPTPATLPTEQ